MPEEAEIEGAVVLEGVFDLIREGLGVGHCGVHLGLGPLEMGGRLGHIALEGPEHRRWLARRPDGSLGYRPAGRRPSCEMR